MMFVLNLKFKNPRIIAISALSVVAVLVFAVAFLKNADFTPRITTATSDEISTYSLRAGDVEERAEFFSQLGIEIDEHSEVVDSVRIPDSFNATYDNYNLIQRKTGLDLSPYSGKIAERFTYRISDGENYAVILVYKGNVIGGHITDGVWGSENLPLF